MVALAIETFLEALDGVPQQGADDLAELRSEALNRSFLLPMFLFFSALYF